MDKDNIRMGGDMGRLSPRMDPAPDEGCGCEGNRPSVELPSPGIPCPGIPCPGTSTPGDSGCIGHEGCPEGGWGLCDHPLGMVYAPCQYFRGLYDPDTALSRGTLFEALDLPLEVVSGASCPLNGRR